MSRLFASWRALKWLAFLFSFALDFYIFHISDPFTPLSFLTSGVAALLMFAFFFEVARAMRGRRRIHRALDDNERISYRVGHRIEWDGKTETVRNDEQANKLLGRAEYRKPWTL